MKHKGSQRIFNIALFLSFAVVLGISSTSIVSYLTSTKLTNEQSSNTPIAFPHQKPSISDETNSRIQHNTIQQKPTFQSMLAEQAELRLQSDVTYNGKYVKIAYPMGDVPANIGVCTDVVIRSYRAMGIDLQQRIHEDMKNHFRKYPTKWKLRRPDTNIDHRRVPNLMTYFKRKGASLAISKNPYDYEKGHLVTWDLGKGLVHIGIVSDKLSMITGHPLIIHNIGSGPEMSDILFRYKITGHYRYGSGDF